MRVNIQGERGQRKAAWSALPRGQTNFPAPAAGCDLQTRPAPQERGASLVCRAARCRRSMVAESTGRSRCAPTASRGRGGRDPDAWWRAACRLGAVATLAARRQPTFHTGGTWWFRVFEDSPGVAGPRVAGARWSSRPSAPDGLDERSAEGRVSRKSAGGRAIAGPFRRPPSPALGLRFPRFGSFPPGPPPRLEVPALHLGLPRPCLEGRGGRACGPGFGFRRARRVSAEHGPCLGIARPSNADRMRDVICNQ